MPRTPKDMSVLRELPSFSSLATGQQASAVLKDYGLQAIVSIEWDLNEDAKRDRVFKIKINGEEAYLDLEELTHYTRLI